jgi:hypothetical protein
VLNTLLSGWDDTEATAVSDVVFLLLGRSGWSVRLVGRYHDTLHLREGTWRFHHRAATFATEPSPGPGDGVRPQGGEG